MPWGDYRVEFAWGALPTSPDFHGWLLGVAGYSEIGVSTYLGWNRIVPPGTMWTDETSRCRTVSFSRGRDNLLDQINPARGELVMNNSDGRFSPFLAASPLHGALLPMTAGRVLCEYGAMTTVGGAVANRAAVHFGNFTWIGLDNPVDHKGRITQVDLWFDGNVTGVKVGTFFAVSADHYTCRDYEVIGAVAGGSAQSFAVSLDCEVGDCLGVFFAFAGVGIGIESDVVGGAGLYYLAGDQMPCSNAAFTLLANQVMSLGGDGVNVYPRWSFLIEEIELRPHPSEQRAVIHAVDALSWLEQMKRTISYSGVTVGELIGEALDSIDWPTEKRILDTGQLGAVSVTYSDAPLLSGHINKALESERGIFLIDREGNAVYEDRHHRYKGGHLVSQGTISGTMIDFAPAISIHRVRNDVQVTYGGGAGTVIRTDAISQLRSGPRTYEVDADLMGAPDATDLADWLLARYKDAYGKPRYVTIANGNVADYTQLLDREISDRVTLEDAPIGISDDFVIEGISEEISFEGWHIGSWLLSRIDPDLYWILGVAWHSELGISTYLGF